MDMENKDLYTAGLDAVEKELDKAQAKDLAALNKLIDDAYIKETALQKQEAELALQNEQFAKVLEQHKRQEAELNVLWDMVKQYMVENNIMSHQTNSLSLSLSPLGKYKAENIDKVPDDLCKIVRSLDNAKVKAYFKLNGSLPEGVTDMGYRLNKKVL